MSYISACCVARAIEEEHSHTHPMTNNKVLLLLAGCVNSCCIAFQLLMFNLVCHVLFFDVLVLVLLLFVQVCLWLCAAPAMSVQCPPLSK